jgi:hypothetical protein
MRCAGVSFALRARSLLGCFVIDRGPLGLVAD